MNSTVVNFPHPEAALQTEATELRRMLEERDILIRSMVGELVQVNQQNREALSSAGPEAPLDAQLLALTEQNQSLQGNVRQLEAQLKAARTGLDERDEELRSSFSKIQELSETNRRLEKHLQDLPELYRRKFTERLSPVAATIQNVQSENRRLQGEMHGMTRKLLAVQEAVAQPLMLMSPAETEAPVSPAVHVPVVDEAAIVDAPPVLRR